MALDRVVITLDALGTLVALEPPAPLLVAELRACGVQVSGREAAVALAAEIAYYRANHDMAADAVSLARLRARCTEVLRAALPATAALPAAELQAALLAALRFVPYDEVPAALRELRAAGHRLVVVSNWDVSLHEMLRTTGLRPLVDGAISSAEAGVPKPAPAIFERALTLAGGAGGRALHAGDSVDHDVAGALAAGFEAVLVVRAGRPPGVPAGVRVVRSLAELAQLAAA
jgi:putative hydrolase of the HAD superfamily